MNDGFQLGLGHSLSLHKLEGLGRSGGIRLGASVDVRQGLELSGGEGVLKDLGPVNDLSGNPNPGGGHDLDGGVDLGLCGGLDLQLRLGDMGKHGGRNDLGDSLIE